MTHGEWNDLLRAELADPNRADIVPRLNDLILKHVIGKNQAEDVPDDKAKMVKQLLGLTPRQYSYWAFVRNGLRQEQREIVAGRIANGVAP